MSGKPSESFSGLLATESVRIHVVKFKKTELHLVIFFFPFLSNNAPPAIYLLTTLASVPEALLTQRPQHISTVLEAAQVVTLLWLFDHCCQHTEMRGEGYDPAVRLKFTLHHQREDRRVTTPPNDSSRKKKKKGRNKSGKMGGDRM